MVLRELVVELLANERFNVTEAEDLSSAAAVAEENPPAVVLVDAMMNDDLAWPLLESPEEVFGPVQPAFVILSGSATSVRVLDHDNVDRALGAPLTSDGLVDALRHHATWPSRRQSRSGAHPIVPPDDSGESTVG